MEISKWDAACYLLSSTGLILMAFSFATPWYRIWEQTFFVLQKESSEVTSEQIVQAMNIVHLCLAFGVFFGWMFLATSFLRPGHASAALGWLSAGLLAVGVVYVLSRAIGSTSGFGLELGWYAGFFALLLIGIAATNDLNKAFQKVKSQAQSGPFVE